MTYKYDNEIPYLLVSYKLSYIYILTFYTKPITPLLVRHFYLQWALNLRKTIDFDDVTTLCEIHTLWDTRSLRYMLQRDPIGLNV
jgi:hypothetical protein